MIDGDPQHLKDAWENYASRYRRDKAEAAARKRKTVLVEDDTRQAMEDYLDAVARAHFEGYAPLRNLDPTSPRPLIPYQGREMDPDLEIPF